MAKSISGSAIDYIVANGVAEWFSAHGFRAKGRSFLRQRDELIQTGYVAASKINMPDAAWCFVTLGVEWPFWNTIWTDRELTGNPAPGPTFIQDGLGRIRTAGKTDQWWSVSRGADLDPDCRGRRECTGSVPRQVDSR